jgi:holo-[acyl-carrier protein] synthase
MVMIAGIGVDIVEIERIGKVLDKHGDRFLDRFLTAAEQTYWRQWGARLETLAGYWAAKEAVAKALGTGFTGFGFSDIAIKHNRLGRPTVELTGGAATLAAQIGVSCVWLSISHSAVNAVAMAIGEVRTS